MSLRIRFLLLSMILGIVFTGFGIPMETTRAEGVTALIGQSTFDVNIRSQPGLNSGTIGILPASAKATAIGRNPGNNWIQIEYSNTTGWVAAWVTVYSGDTYLLPVTSDINPAPISGPNPFVLTSPYNVNIRSEPSVNAASLGRLPYKAKSTAIARNETSSWVFIEYEGVQGWVAAWLTLLNYDINALPVESGSSNPATPQPASTPSTPLTPPPGGGIIVQSPSRANIRSVPSLTGTVIDTLPYTETAIAVGRNAGNNWLQVSRGVTTGWVARWVVLSSDDTSGLPITSDSAEVIPATGAIMGRSPHDVIIRSEPSLLGSQISVLPAGSKGELLARTSATNWIRIRYGETEGWVAAWVIVATSDMTTLPVE